MSFTDYLNQSFQLLEPCTWRLGSLQVSVQGVVVVFRLLVPPALAVYEGEEFPAIQIILFSKDRHPYTDEERLHNVSMFVQNRLVTRCNYMSPTKMSRLPSTVPPNQYAEMKAREMVERLSKLRRQAFACEARQRLLSSIAVGA